MGDSAAKVLDLRSIDGLARAVGSHIDAVTASFGDEGATWRLALRDGRVVAARQVEPPGAGAAAERLAAITNRLSDHAIPVAAPATAHEAGGAWWVLTPWIDGRSGRDVLAHPGSSVSLARSMGALAAQLRAVPPEALGTGADSVDPFAPDGRLAGLMARWQSALEVVEGALSDHARGVVRMRWAQLSTGNDWDPVVVHGDFAPVNVVLDLAGRIAALVDLDRVGPGPPEADVAWWGWVLRHHHPEAWQRAMPAFLEAAGAAVSSAARERRAALVLAALTAAVARGVDDRHRGAWLERLETAAGWSGEVG